MIQQYLIYKEQSIVIITEMRIFYLILAISLLSGCVYRDNLAKLSLASREQSTSGYYKVSKIIDGDTIEIDLDGKAERVRMIGINTPESVDPNRPVECLGKEAALEARKLLEGKQIRLKADISQDDRDKYNRLLRYVWTKEGLFYNLEILKRGLAKEYTYQKAYDYQQEFRAAETAAKNANKGLWSKTACEQQKTIAQPKILGIKTVAEKNLCDIKGNINYKKQKIYHLPSCRDYKKTTINPENNDRWFCTEDEARKSGFRKAYNCP